MSEEKKKEIVWGPTDEVDAADLRPYLDRIRKALGLDSWYISNGSKVGDFSMGLGPHVPALLTERLGVPVEDNDLLVDVAQRLRAKQWGGEEYE